MIKPEFIELIKKVSAEYGIEPAFLGAIVMNESSGRQYITKFEPEFEWTFEVLKFAKKNSIPFEVEHQRQSTSYGLCQVMGSVGREFGITGNIFELFDPETNLETACKLLKRLKQKHKTEPDLFSAYNAGSVKFIKPGVYKNQKYVDDALANKEVFKKQYLGE